MKHPKDILAAELLAVGEPELARMAALGYYDERLSPFALPEVQLSIDLDRAGTPEAKALWMRYITALARRGDELGSV
jgi:hypothetical protein